MKPQLLSPLLLGPALAQAQTNSTPLKAGDSIPDVTLRTEEDKEVSLRKLVSEKPTVLIFYRGGWCTHYNRNLQSLSCIEKELGGAGVQLPTVIIVQRWKVR